MKYIQQIIEQISTPTNKKRELIAFSIVCDLNNKISAPTAIMNILEESNRKLTRKKAKKSYLIHHCLIFLLIQQTIKKSEQNKTET